MQSVMLLVISMAMRIVCSADIAEVQNSIATVLKNARSPEEQQQRFNEIKVC